MDTLAKCQSARTTRTNATRVLFARVVLVTNGNRVGDPSVVGSEHDNRYVRLELDCARDQRMLRNSTQAGKAREDRGVGALALLLEVAVTVAHNREQRIAFAAEIRDTHALSKEELEHRRVRASAAAAVALLAPPVAADVAGWRRVRANPCANGE